MRKMNRKNWTTAIGIVVGGVSMLFVSCEDEDTTATGEGGGAAAELETVLAERKELEQKIEDLRTANQAKSKDAKAKAEAKDEELKQLKSELKALKEEKATLEEDYEKYKEDYKASIRTNAKGIELGTITLKNGTEYKKVVVSKWEPEHLRVMHSLGSAKLAFADLPEKVQKMFVYDSAETQVFVASTDKGQGTELKGSGSTSKTKPEIKPEAPKVYPEEPKKKKLTRSEIALARVSRQIDSLETEINRIDKLIEQAYSGPKKNMTKGRSLEKQAMRIMESLKTLRANRADLQRKIDARRT